MVANSENSVTADKQSTKSTVHVKRAGERAAKPVSQPEAVEILMSALAYCRQAGFSVRAANQADQAGVILALDGLIHAVEDAGGVRLVAD